ncbi:hypothetical protein X777_16736 [Ooceraea biroi]|uniref:Uncharacterized protein n=1 Tax=Ooceraea biroi TaxID=2015173 RepID=A0A026VUD3_OOCBI|nr:hypothetical protein X777_16736 [Ooceraea biroi]
MIAGFSRDVTILDYISRVKDLRLSIIDADRRARGTLTANTTAEIDALTRQYNNSQREQGNFSRPSRTTDEPRVGKPLEPSRAVRTISVEPVEQQESQS